MSAGRCRTWFIACCGTGYWLRELLKWGARPENVVGMDLLASRLGEAERLVRTRKPCVWQRFGAWVSERIV